jgi:Mn-dependent DtxR family transcriptional regulator
MYNICMVKNTYERAKVYQFMVDYCVSTGGLPPTRQEIADHLGGASKSSVSYILKELARRGLVKFGRAGVAQVVGGRWTPPEGKEG